MPYSTATDVTIYYEVSGDGPAMVLVHANPFDRRLWMYQVARFSRFFTVVNVDIRGYGLSDKPETSFTLEDMANDVLGVCEAEGIDKAIFAGVSVGSGIALLVGLNQPDIAQALVLVGGSSRGGARIQNRIDGYTSGDFASYRHDHLCQTFAPGFPQTPSGRWVLTMFDENSDTLSPESIAQIFRARAGCTMTPRLGEVRAPTLVINGEHDPSMEAGMETAAGIPDGRHVVIPGTGHACCIEDPASFDAPVIEFLTSNALWPKSVTR